MDSNQRIYQITHQCLSKDHKFEIHNQTNDQIDYSVRSKSLINQDELILYEQTNGNELIEISKVFVHLHSRYNLSANKKDLATIEKNHSTKSYQIGSIYGFYQIECFDEHSLQLKSGHEILFQFIKNSNHLSKDKHFWQLILFDKDQTKDPFYISIAIVLYILQRCHHFQ